MGKRAQRIPSWPGVIHSNKGRIHLRRPTCDILTFRLRRSGGPYIPVSPSTTRNPSATPHEDSPQIDHERPRFFDGFDSVSMRILLLQMTVLLRDRKGSND